MMRRVLLFITLIAFSTHALAQGRTIACSSDLHTRVACYVEQTVAVIGAFEFGIGIDTLAAHRSHVAPYVVAGYYAPMWSVTTEYALPAFSFLGRASPFRVSFTFRF
jgi:hypothetical protein